MTWCCCMLLSLRNLPGAVHNHPQGHMCFCLWSGERGPCSSLLRPDRQGQAGSGTRPSSLLHRSPSECPVQRASLVVRPALCDPTFLYLPLWTLCPHPVAALRLPPSQQGSLESCSFIASTSFFLFFLEPTLISLSTF